MQCSVCEKIFATTLSICPSCGAMASSHTHGDTILRSQIIEKITTADLEIGSNEIESFGESEEVSQFAAVRQKREISSTLIEFPDKRRDAWREEIKNRVQQHREQNSDEESPQQQKETKIAAARTARVQSSKITAFAPEPALIINLKPNVADQTAAERLKMRALERIERSRRRFESDTLPESELEFPPIIKDDLPNFDAAPEVSKTSLSFTPRRILPAIVDDAGVFSDSIHETESNKDGENREIFAPRLIPTKAVVREKGEVEIELDADELVAESLRSVRKTTKIPNPLEEQEIAERTSTANEFRRQSSDDFAPLAPRFIAGLIDAGLSAAIVAVGFALFAQMPSLGDFNWQIIAAFAVVEFLYLTTALILSGTTIGMWFFKLQVVNAENGNVPAPFAAIINSSIYLLTFAFAGVGLLAILFSPEKRALHDFCAGTIVTKNFD